MEKFKKKVILKLGRSIVTNHDNSLNKKLFTHLAQQIIELQKKNFGIILVVSGAIVSGKKRYNNKSTLDLHKGLLASIGQIILSCDINSIFSKKGLIIGQILLTKSDLENEKKVKQLKEIVHDGLHNNIVLVFNENDAIEHRTFYGNDFLATKLGQTINAHSLLLLTDIEGVLDKKMKLLAALKESEISNIANLKKVNDKGQIGGMKAKIKAAFMAKKRGINCVIAYGKTKNILTRIFIDNEKIGTEIL